jgi:alpha-ribazole phosphatase
MKTIYFVRHGESIFNLEKRFAGWSDCALTPLGKRQANEVASRMKTFVDIERILSSDLIRAYDTAHEIAHILSLPIHVDKRLREVHLGLWEGKTMEYINEHYPDEVKTWFSDYIGFCYPEGETIKEMLVRTEASIQEQLENYDTILVVAHAGVISNILAKWVLGDEKKSPAFHIKNACIQKIVIDRDYTYLDLLNG